MNNREQHIEFHRNYCVHYDPQPGKTTIGCTAGLVPREAMLRTPQAEAGLKCRPCIGGHNLSDPLAYCPKWERPTMESAEESADGFEELMDRMEIVMPVVSKWRIKPKPKQDRREVIECPKCKGRLHLSQSSYNGHVHGSCETEGCVRWME